MYANRVAELVEIEQTIARQGHDRLHHAYSNRHDPFHNNDIDYDEETDFALMGGDLQSLNPADLPPRTQSLLPRGSDQMMENIQSTLHQPSIVSSYYATPSDMKTSYLTVEDSMRAEYIPPPLSPRSPLSPSSGEWARE